MSEFKRENRYLVFKLSDIESSLDHQQKMALDSLASVVNNNRALRGKAPLDGVVVESDWPIYERVWALIKRLGEDAGRAIERAQQMADSTDVQLPPTEQDCRELQDKHDELLSMLITVKRERDGLIQQLKQTSDSLNDKIVTMQAAVIDAKQNGPEAGMQWITNTLWGPGLIPVESEPWVNNAQHYYSHNCSNPLGPCGVCGAPSSVSGAGHVACCMEHHKQLKGGAA